MENSEPENQNAKKILDLLGEQAFELDLKALRLLSRGKKLIYEKHEF